MMGHGSWLMDEVGFWMHLEALGWVFGVFWTDLGGLGGVWEGSGRGLGGSGGGLGGSWGGL